MRSDDGIDILLDLPQARPLHHGDGLVLDDASAIKMCAEPLPLAPDPADALS